MIRFARVVVAVDRIADWLRGCFKKILQKNESGPTAFLRVKLGGDDISLLNAADKLAPVVGCRQYRRGIISHYVVRMNKIKFFITVKTGKNPRGLFEVESVPSDMRHRKINDKTLYFPGD